MVVRKRIIGDPDIPPEHRQLADSWIAEWVAREVPSLSGDTGVGGMYDRLEEWAEKPLHWREEVSARMPSPRRSGFASNAAHGCSGAPRAPNYLFRGGER